MDMTTMALCTHRRVCLSAQPPQTFKEGAGIISVAVHLSSYASPSRVECRQGAEFRQTSTPSERDRRLSSAWSAWSSSAAFSSHGRIPMLRSCIHSSSENPHIPPPPEERRDGRLAPADALSRLSEVRAALARDPGFADPDASDPSETDDSDPGRAGAGCCRSKSPESPANGWRASSLRRSAALSARDWGRCAIPSSYSLGSPVCLSRNAI
mmetsp:Transcript_20791/g.46556  ORF Transcript_20791/g.46556 Transcript_20791/m.46556 type:complete len:211 (-) Transcript_20791:24-656(-)